MEVEAGLVQFNQRSCRLERRKAHRQTLAQIRRDPSPPTLLQPFAEPTMPRAVNHGFTLSTGLHNVKYRFTAQNVRDQWLPATPLNFSYVRRPPIPSMPNTSCQSVSSSAGGRGNA